MATTIGVREIREAAPRNVNARSRTPKTVENLRGGRRDKITTVPHDLAFSFSIHLNNYNIRERRSCNVVGQIYLSLLLSLSLPNFLRVQFLLFCETHQNQH